MQVLDLASPCDVSFPPLNEGLPCRRSLAQLKQPSLSKMGVTTHPFQERRLMRTQYTAGIAALTRFLTPQAWKQAHQLHAPKKTPSRWDLHATACVLLLMT